MTTKPVVEERPATCHKTRKDFGIALLGCEDKPMDALVDYLHCLSSAMKAGGFDLRFVRVSWEKIGWFRALWNLWKDAGPWRGNWVLVQYTALQWSRRGVSLRLLFVLGILRLRGAKMAMVFHDVRPYGGRRLVDRVRTFIQDCVMKTACRWTRKSVLPISLDRLPWLKGLVSKAVYIPIGAVLYPPRHFPEWLAKERKTVAVFGVTGGKRGAREVENIRRAVQHAAGRVASLNLVVLGRGSDEAREQLREAFQDSGVKVTVLGIVPLDEIVRTLAASDALLFVRGEVSTRRSTAMAAVVCGVPLVGYTGADTGEPLKEAGAILVPEGKREALAEALVRVLTDDDLQRELRRRNRSIQKTFFSWDVIGEKFLRQVVGHD
jgi:glycosyltransferase involved in cell wall biosynthesis